MVNSSTRGNSAWFDIRGIQGDKIVDDSVRKTVMSQFRRALSLIAPADIVNLGLGLSSVPGIDMSGDSGQVYADLQDMNEQLAAQNASLATRIARLEDERP